MTAPNNVTPPTVGDGNPSRHDNKKGKKPFYKRWWFWLIVVLVVIGAIGAGQSGTDTSTTASTKSNTSQTASAPAKPSESAKPAEPAKPAEKTVELQATSTGNATVIIDKNGSTSNDHFSGSWSKTYTGDETKDLESFSVSTDITGGDNQQVSCKVIVNGQEKVSKEASGAMGLARCNIPWF